MIEPDLSEFAAADTAASIPQTHGMDPVRVLTMVKSMGGQLNKLILVGCEPETFGPEEGLIGLSQSVQAAVPEAMKVIESLIAKQLEAPVGVSA